MLTNKIKNNRIPRDSLFGTLASFGFWDYGVVVIVVFFVLFCFP